jgi:hypothetical protein
MKFLKKISLVYSLQIMAVIMLFFFPGFSSSPDKVGTNTGNTVPGNKSYGIPDDSLYPLQKTGGPFFIHQYPEPAVRKFILITGAR